MDTQAKRCFLRTAASRSERVPPSVAGSYSAAPDAKSGAPRASTCGGPSMDLTHGGRPSILFAALLQAVCEACGNAARGSRAACSHPGYVEHRKGEQPVVHRLPPRVSGRVRPVRCARVRCEVRKSRDRLAGGDARLPLGAVQVGLQPAQQGRDLGLVAAADLANLACGAAARSRACAACGRTYECHKYAICDMKIF